LLKEIRYSTHLNVRLKLRDIPYELPAEIYLSPTERHFDAVVEREIAIKPVKYKGKIREMMIVYEEHQECVVIVTIHPLKKNQKDNRIKTGRWLRRE